jgi:predicted MPP superfamily phosphohydrolase
MDLSAAPHSSHSRRSLLTRRAFLGAAGAVTVGLALDAGEIGRHDLVIERRAIRIPRLPEAFSGLRIAQISDIHFAEYTEPSFVERVVREVNALGADIVVLTGDFVTMAPVFKSEAEYYAPVVAQHLAKITCPFRYAVMGNHDWMVNAAVVTESLESVGITVLANENLPFERDGARLWIAGTADALSQECDIPRSLPKHAQHDREPVVLMLHEPDLLPAVAQLNAVDLMLSGHTHGGQVRLPFLPPIMLPPLGRHFVEGHFQMGRTQLYVNRGIGAVALPFRFRCPAEITELTLQPS